MARKLPLPGAEERRSGPPGRKRPSAICYARSAGSGACRCCSAAALAVRGRHELAGVMLRGESSVTTALRFIRIPAAAPDTGGSQTCSSQSIMHLLLSIVAVVFAFLVMLAASRFVSELLALISDKGAVSVLSARPGRMRRTCRCCRHRAFHEHGCHSRCPSTPCHRRSLRPTRPLRHLGRST